MAVLGLSGPMLTAVEDEGVRAASVLVARLGQDRPALRADGVCDAKALLVTSLSEGSS